MVDVFGLTSAQFETFLLVFIRVSAMLFLYPIFSASQIPIQLRFGMSAIISFLIYRAIPQQPVSGDFYTLALAVLSQVALGMIVGFVAQLVFVGIQFAGELIDLQIGFAVANVINPTTQQNVTIIGEFELAIATLVFLATDGLHVLLLGIAGSFNLVPLPYIKMDPALTGNVLLFVSQAFLVVFKISAPVSIALFLTNVVLAFATRVAPQMNVLVIGLPLQIGVGFVMLSIALPLLGIVGPQLFHDVGAQMDIIMRSMRP